jgi:glutaryl-CoA dehydrogenase (non-decarboxylating)
MTLERLLRAKAQSTCPWGIFEGYCRGIMEIQLNCHQEEAKNAFRAFVVQEIIPQANYYDREEYTPGELIVSLAQRGYLGACVPASYGGQAMDMITFGALNEEIGRGCSSIRSLLTVHSMASYAIHKWGNTQQKQDWLPRLASGERLAAFALSEPEAGSDAKNLQTTAALSGDTYHLTGRKKWITYGQIADVFLLFAREGERISAFLVERDTPGLEILPLTGMLGTRASMLAELHLHDCCIPEANRLGGRGFGLAGVATSALDIGRYSVACGCVGLAQACLDDSLDYARKHRQFGQPLKDFQLIQQMLTDMITHVKAARLLCYRAGYLKDLGSPDTIPETWVAKYFASTTAFKIASDAVQIHGAYGCSPDASVQRYLRDAKIMEIIEGSTQIQQTTIAQYGYQETGIQGMSRTERVVQI